MIHSPRHASPPKGTVWGTTAASSYSSLFRAPSSEIHGTEKYTIHRPEEPRARQKWLRYGVAPLGVETAISVTGGPFEGSENIISAWEVFGSREFSEPETVHAFFNPEVSETNSKTIHSINDYFDTLLSGKDPVPQDFHSILMGIVGAVIYFISQFAIYSSQMWKKTQSWARTADQHGDLHQRAGVKNPQTPTYDKPKAELFTTRKVLIDLGHIQEIRRKEANFYKLDTAVSDPNQQGAFNEATFLAQQHQTDYAYLESKALQLISERPEFNPKHASKKRPLAIDLSIPNEVMAHYLTAKEVRRTSTLAAHRPEVYGFAELVAKRLNKTPWTQHQLRDGLQQFKNADDAFNGLLTYQVPGGVSVLDQLISTKTALAHQLNVPTQTQAKTDSERRELLRLMVMKGATLLEARCADNYLIRTNPQAALESIIKNDMGFHASGCFQDEGAFRLLVAAAHAEYQKRQTLKNQNLSEQGLVIYLSQGVAALYASQCGISDNLFNRLSKKDRDKLAKRSYQNPVTQQPYQSITAALIHRGDLDSYLRARREERRHQRYDLCPGRFERRFTKVAGWLGGAGACSNGLRGYKGLVTLLALAMMGMAPSLVPLIAPALLLLLFSSVVAGGMASWTTTRPQTMRLFGRLGRLLDRWRNRDLPWWEVIVNGVSFVVVSFTTSGSAILTYMGTVTILTTTFLIPMGWPVLAIAAAFAAFNFISAGSLYMMSMPTFLKNCRERLRVFLRNVTGPVSFLRKCWATKGELKRRLTLTGGRYEKGFKVLGVIFGVLILGVIFATIYVSVATSFLFMLALPAGLCGAFAFATLSIPAVMKLMGKMGQWVDQDVPAAKAKITCALYGFLIFCGGVGLAFLSMMALGSVLAPGGWPFFFAGIGIYLGFSLVGGVIASKLVNHWHDKIDQSPDSKALWGKIKTISNCLLIGIIPNLLMTLLAAPFDLYDKWKGAPAKSQASVQPILQEVCYHCEGDYREDPETQFEMASRDFKWFAQNPDVPLDFGPQPVTQSSLARA